MSTQKIQSIIESSIAVKQQYVADAAFLDLGTYPIFLASDTTFSLNVALSMNTSFVTILVLYEVM